MLSNPMIMWFEIMKLPCIINDFEEYEKILALFYFILTLWLFIVALRVDFVRKGDVVYTFNAALFPERKYISDKTGIVFFDTAFHFVSPNFKKAK